MHRSVRVSCTNAGNILPVHRINTSSAIALAFLGSLSLLLALLLLVQTHQVLRAALGCQLPLALEGLLGLVVRPLVRPACLLRASVTLLSLLDACVCSLSSWTCLASVYAGLGVWLFLEHECCLPVCFHWVCRPFVHAGR